MSLKWVVFPPRII